MTKISRRNFLKSTGLAASTTLLCNASSTWGQSGTKQWFKGNLHMHNQWSDGSPLPEFAVNWYKSHGYHFICPSDHNIFQSSDLRFDNGFGHKTSLKDFSAFEGETSYWKELTTESGWAKLNQKTLEETANLFGKDSIQTKEVDGRTFVRLKTFDELAAQFEEDGRFLMIPGFEQTGGTQDHFGEQVHMNFINVRSSFPYITGTTPSEILSKTYDHGQALYEGQDYLFTANHPMWRYYDFSPCDLMMLSKIRLFELNNNGLDGSYELNAQAWTPEKFWDAVNALRVSHDQELLFGMGSDDRHGYGGPARAWSVVRAEKLEISALLQAIREGDFYASNGLDFEDIQFDGKTLAVKIKAQDEGKYRIIFVGTKKGYDASVKSIHVAKGEKNPERQIDLFSEDVGVVLDTVEGMEGAYTLTSDDLYVRAKIVKVDDNLPLQGGWETQQAAWSQPYRS